MDESSLSSTVELDISSLILICALLSCCFVSCIACSGRLHKKKQRRRVHDIEFGLGIYGPPPYYHQAPPMMEEERRRRHQHLALEAMSQVQNIYRRHQETMATATQNVCAVCSQDFHGGEWCQALPLYGHTFLPSCIECCPTCVGDHTFNPSCIECCPTCVGGHGMHQAT